MAGGAVRPPAIAAAMNGAVQGVATSTASSPVKKLPAWPARPVSACRCRPGGPPMSKTPERLRPTASSSQLMPATKAGDWSWKPQPAAEPAAAGDQERAAECQRRSTSMPAV